MFTLLAKYTLFFADAFKGRINVLNHDIYEVAQKCLFQYWNKEMFVNFLSMLKAILFVIYI